MHPHKIGLIAEYIVAINYLFRGFIPIKHRYKSKLGEIDLIFKKGNLIVFCEVKARNSKYSPEDLVSPNQKRRIIKSAEAFLAKNKQYSKCNARFDLAVVRSIFNTEFYNNWIN